MASDLLSAIPSYETDFAQLGEDHPQELNSFDHLGAYRALGPIYSVRFRGDDWICIGGVEANAAAWKNPDLWNYGAALKPFREIMGPRHVTQMDGPAHREKRRQLKPGFAMSAVVRWIPLIDGMVREQLGAVAGRPISLHEYFMLTLTHANAATVLKADLDEEGARTFIRFEEEFISGTIKAEDDRAAYYGRESFLRDKAYVFDFLRHVIEERLAGKVVDDNFAPVIERTLADRDELDMEELVSEAYLLLMAGTGNTAKLLNVGLQHIIRNPELLEKLRAEVAGYSPEAFLQGMEGYPLLKATIMEMERLFPAAPVLSRVVAQPFEFAGHQLEKGMKVLHLQTLPHFLEEVYEEPYRFKPERWLENDYSKKAFGTFGGSTHICLGMNLARIHMPVTLANILQNYDLIPESEPGIEIDINYGVPQVADIRGVFEPRS